MAIIVLAIIFMQGIKRLASKVSRYDELREYQIPF